MKKGFPYSRLVFFSALLALLTVLGVWILRVPSTTKFRAGGQQSLDAGVVSADVQTASRQSGEAPTSGAVLIASNDTDRGGAQVSAAQPSVLPAQAAAVDQGGTRAVVQTGATSLAELLAKPMDLTDPGKRAALVAQVKALEEAERVAVHAKARQLGLPITGTGATGRRFVLRGFEGDTPVYEEPDNANAAISTTANRVRLTAPYQVDGTGLAFGLWEAGGVPRLTHQEFGGKISIRDGSVSSTDHATHVAGTLAGLGINPAALGMAPAASIHAYDSINDVSEMLAAGAAFAGEAGKIQISNHSYGARRGWYDDGVTWLGVFSDDADRTNDVDYGFGRYDAAAATLDGMAYNLPYYLAFFSNGNMRTRGPPAVGVNWYQGYGGVARAYDPAQHPAGNGQYKAGYDTMDGRKTAKNILSIGAANDAVNGGQRHLPFSTIASFSSSGPTDDGRIKPDVVANGVSLTSAGVSSDSSYYSSSGTSMSTPNAAGSAMLLADLYQRRFPGLAMRASTLKGLILHTADDIGIPGPDYLYGWGLMNTEAAANLIEMQAEGGSNPTLIEDVLSLAQPSQTYSFTWNGTDPIRVTLCWTDPPAASSSTHDLRSPALINDLNLSVTAPDGATHLPFVMPYVGDWSVAKLTAPAERGVNHVDNVEQVLVESPPQPGVYTVTVNHVGSLTNGTQPYSVILSGGGVPGELQVTPIEGWVSSGDAGGPFVPAAKTYTLRNQGANDEAWTASVNQPWLSVSAASGTVAAGAEVEVTVALAEAAADLPVGMYEGIVTLTAGGTQFLRPVSLQVVGHPHLVVEHLEGAELSNGAGLAFDNLLVGARKIRRFVIRNIGNQSLNLGSPSLTGAAADDFSTTLLGSSTIPAGGRVYLNVSFAPQTAGVKTATLSVPSDDGDNSPFLLQLSAGAVPAGEVRLTRAINAQVGGISPFNMMAMEGYALFGAADPLKGQELWRSDGTAEGTFLLKDIYDGGPNSVPAGWIRLGNVAYFSAANGPAGNELWRSDGTQAGTTLVLDINAGSASSSVTGLTEMGGTLFFRATTTANGAELWKSDGTAAGTVLIRDIQSGTSSSNPSNLTEVNGTLFFSAFTTTSGLELWKSDGTPAGTVLVKDINPGSTSSTPGNFIEVGGQLYFTASDSASGAELWRSDGTAAGTVRVKDINPGSNPSSPLGLVAMDEVLYFRATTAASGYELWRSDGSEEGTQMVKELLPGTGSGLTTTPFVHNDRLYFSGSDGALGAELWASDGTAVGTVLVKDLYTGANNSTPQLFISFGGELFFSAFTLEGREIWRTDGTAAGTVQVKDIYPGSGSASPLTPIDIGSCLLFSADDGLNGRELWRSDGTEAGTWMVKDSNPNPVANTTFGNLSDVAGTLYFGASNGTLGIELWRTDGTVAGTHLVKDINSGNVSSNPAGMTAVQGGLIFAANTLSTGTEPYFSDGTEAGTQLLLDIAPGIASSTVNNHLKLGSEVFFTATQTGYGNELWKSDGTTAGTVLVKDINAGSASSSPVSFCDFNGVLFFAASNGANGSELWRSDGTTAGTYMVKDIAPGAASSNPQQLTAIGDWLYFSASDGTSGFELWRSDGTQEGTFRVIDLEPGSGNSAPSQITYWNGAIYFAATTTFTGLELWKTDGTVLGTVLVKDVQSGSASSQLRGLTALPNGLIFAASSSSNNIELWRSDGTAAGTFLLKEIYPGATSSSPGKLVRLGVHVYFRAYHPDYGGELWRSDGTMEGTVLVEDLYQGPSSSFSPTEENLVVSGSKLYFTATHSDYGLQLFHVEGVFPPQLAIEKPAGTPRLHRTAIDLGMAFAGYGSPHVLTLRNLGDQPLHLSAVNKSGTDAASFNLGLPVQNPLPPGESTPLALTFQPDTEGVKSTLLEIHSNDPDTPVYELTLSGAGIGAPNVRVEQPAGSPLTSGVGAIAYPTVLLGSSTGVRTFTVINDVPGTQLEIGDITLSGPHAADFHIVRGGMQATLAGNATTTFGVDFVPRGAGARSATLSLASNDPDGSPFLITLTGTGIGAAGPVQNIIADSGRSRRPSDGSFPLQAFATSGLPLSYEVLAGPASVDGSGLVTPTGGGGAVTIRIRQAGGSGYNAVESFATFLLGEWPVFTQLYAAQNAPAIYAIRDDGTLWTWGYSSVTSYLGATVSIGRVTPDQVGAFNDWTRVTPGNAHGVGLRANGSLWSWGSNSYGQIGDGTSTTRTSPTQIGAGKLWMDVSAGSNHSAAVASDGTLWTWGYNFNGQLGLGDVTQRSSPVQVGTDTHWRRVICGGSFTLALTDTGEIWAWGQNSNGQLGIGNTAQQTLPVRVGSNSDWTALAAGNFHAAALRADGTLWAWGLNSSGQLGDGTTSQRTSPVQIGSATDWQSVRAGSNMSAARKVDGSLWVWGQNNLGQLGDGTLMNRNSPQRFAEGRDWRDIATGISHVAALREDGTVWVAGESYGFSGVSPRTLTPAAVTGESWQQLSGSGSTYLALRADGTLWGWGYGGWGTLGNGFTSDRVGLVQIGTGNQWDFVEVGSHSFFGNTSFAIQTDGTLWAAGYNVNFNLGDGTTSQRSSFVQIGAATDWHRVSAAQNHGLGLKTNGSLWAWGLNSNGQLGDGSTVTGATPKQIGSDTDWAQVVGGYSHSLGLKTDGSLWGWGFNGGGQLGLGDNSNRLIPTRIGNDTDWVAVAAGGHTLALKADGSLWAWGSNTTGALGLGDTSSRFTPVRVGVENHWQRIWVTRGSSLAQSADGRLWAAGENHSGHLGHPNMANLLTFTQVADAAFQQVALGSSSLAALSADGTFWTAGAAGSRVLGGARDSKRPLLVLPGLATQSITPWQEGQLSGDVSASSGLPVQFQVLSGSVEITGNHLAHTGPKGSTAVVQAWQPGDESAWNAAPPVRLTLERPFGNLQVLEGANELASGTSTVDFGTVIAGASAVRTFTLVNDAPGILDLSDLDVTGNWSLDTTDISLSLAPGHSTQFTVSFSPTTFGGHNGLLTLRSDDPDQPEFTVAFIGQGRLAQSLTFDPIAEQACGTPLQLAASAGSGLPVSYEITEGAAIADLQDDTVTFTGTGSVTLRASQPGNDTYAAAEPVSRSFTVVRGVQFLAFHPATPSSASHRASLTLSAASDRGLSPVNFQVLAGPGQISGTTLTFISPGEVLIQAAQAGDDLFLPATTQFTLTATNAAPVATAASAEGDEDTVLAGQLTAVDSDGDELTFSAVTAAAHGTAVVNANGSFTYSPGADYHGTDSFMVKASDGLADSDIVTVSLTLLPVNDAPVAQAQTLTTSDSVALAITLVGTDVEDDTLSYHLMKPPEHGELGGTAPALSYLSDAGYSGSDSFTFKVNDGHLDSEEVTVHLTINPVAPAITTDLAGHVVNPGARVELRVTTTGSLPLTYVWRKGGEILPGADSATLVLDPAEEMHEGLYQVSISNSLDTVHSAEILLGINDPVQFAAHPQSRTVSETDEVVFNVGFSGTGPFTYQWRKNGGELPGETGAELRLASVTEADEGEYDVVVRNVVGDYPSEKAVLQVVAGLPQFVQEPADHLLLSGTDLILQATALGRPPLSYQWRFNGKPIKGATDRVLALYGVGLAQAGRYSVLVTSAQSVESRQAEVAVVVNQPVTRVLAEKTKAVLKVQSAGNGLGHTWTRDGGPLPADARFAVAPDGRTLTIANTVADDSGLYACVVSAPGGECSSGTVDLRVFDGPPVAEAQNLPDGIVGGLYEHQVILGGDADGAASAFKAKGLPPGVKINAATGLLRGVPAKAGTYEVLLTASNKFGSVEMEEALVVHDYPGNLAGAYTALVARQPALNRNIGGRLDLTLTSLGSASGKLVLGDQTHAFKAALILDPAGVARPRVEVRLPRTGSPPPQPLSLELEIDTRAQAFVTDEAGSTLSRVHAGNDEAGITGWRNVWHAKNRPANNHAGFYTFALESNAGEAAPQGNGFGSFRLSTAGMAKVAGKVADGTSHTSAGCLSPEGRLAVFAPLYGKPIPGSLCGLLEIEPGDAVEDVTDNPLSGTLDWLRPDRRPGGGLLYPAGFGPLDLAVLGGHYSKPASPMGRVPGHSVAQLRFASGGIENSETVPNLALHLDERNRLTLATPNPGLVSFKTDAAKAVFNGSFTLNDPHWSKPAPARWTRKQAYQGILIQTGSAYTGHGYFLLPQLPEADPKTAPVLSGQVLLE